MLFINSRTISLVNLKKMKKNNTIIIISIIGIIALAGLLFYFGVALAGLRSYLGGKNQSAVSINTTIGPHGHNTEISADPALLNSIVNKPAPDFSLTDRDGRVYSSANLQGKNVLLFFNEGLMCYPACWNQIALLSQDRRFKSNDTVALSVVVDPKEDWQQAVNKMPELAQATVVFDNNASVSKKFGVLTAPSSMHPGLFPGHTYVVIDREGIIRYVLDDPNMGIHNDHLAAEISKFF